jgi:MFS family permease
VLSGVSFSVSTPNRIGEYLGRILYIEEGNRLRAISLTIVSSMSQLIITLFMGIIGLFFLQKKIISDGIIASSIWIQVLQYVAIIVLAILTLIYFRISFLTKLIEKIPNISRYIYLINALENIHATLLVRLLSLSFARYIIFAVQYFLLFQLFEVHINWWETIWSISVIFLVLAIIPTFAIAELGLRGKVSLALIGLFSANDLGISIATATVWFINLVLPAMTGSLLILSIKIFKNRNERNQSN